jgi:four helix bundle protein
MATVETLALSQALASRTRQFALQALRFSQAMRRTDEARILGRQLFRSATGAAANYRAATRSRSRREFVARIAVALEEADETVFWLELALDAGFGDRTAAEHLLEEAKQLVAIFGASLSTARRGLASRAKEPDRPD